MSAIEQLLASRDDGPTAGRPRLPSSARLTLILVLASTAVILPFSHHDLGPQRTFIPLVLTVVVVLDLVSVYLLTVRFCDTGDLRILLMALAYLWSCLMVVAWAMSFPGVISDHPPLGTWPSATPWIYLAWHVGFPALMAVAWGIPGRCAKTVPDGRRRRVATALIAASIVTALVVIAGIAVGEHVLPVLIVGVDTTRMSTIGGPPSMLIAVASAVIVHVRLRHRSGPERWASVTVWVCVADLTLTFWSLHRYSVGWYAGRTLTVVCSSLVFFAMLGEFTALQRRLLRARNEAVSAAIMQRNFAMSASHELRTPTTSILGYIEEVLDNEKLDEEDREMLDIAHRNTQRLARLVDDLLILGEAEMGPAMMHLVSWKVDAL